MSLDKLIYLDNAATTRVAPEVVAAMEPYFLDNFHNPATLYRDGEKAAAAMQAAREQLAGLLGASPQEIYYTSGGTESNNWVIKAALLGQEKKHVVTSASEHHAVLDPLKYLHELIGCEVTILGVDGEGRVDPDDLRSALRPDTALVSIMYGNNETGTVQPIAELAAVARAQGVLFHTDAVQAVGKVPLDMKALGVDFLSLSGHKFHGPKGAGALFIRRDATLASFQHGGGQEQGRRAGTNNVPGIVGLGKAAELARASLEAERKKQGELVERLWKKLSDSISGIRRNGHPDFRLPGILNLCVEGVEGEMVLLHLDQRGVQVSSAAACMAGSIEPSYVLAAMGVPAEVARGAVRFSLGRETTAAEIERVIEIMPAVVARLRRMK